MTRVAILQSNYIPWKGYFDLIGSVDEFVLYDDVQYTKHDWRNRNRIKTPQGVSWLSIPVGRDIKRHIRDVKFRSQKWQSNHWKTLETNYRRAPSFEEIAEWLKPLYLSSDHTHLSTSNRAFIEAICRYLKIQTRISWSWEFPYSEGRTERLASLCSHLGAKEYLTGPSAASYLDLSAFSKRGISVSWFRYANYPEYPQLWGTFDHRVTILDLLFNCGNRARKYMKSSEPSEQR